MLREIDDLLGMWARGRRGREKTDEIGLNRKNAGIYGGGRVIRVLAGGARAWEELGRGGGG